MLYAKQSYKNVIANIRILVVHKFNKKEKKNNTCKSEPIGLKIFVIELLYDKTTIK